jgi:hypothetical protein
LGDAYILQLVFSMNYPTITTDRLRMRYFFIVFFFAPFLGFSQESNQALFLELDEAIARKDEYESIRRQEIQDLNDKIGVISEENHLELFTEFQHLHEALYTLDFEEAMNSSLGMLEQAKFLEDPELIAQARIKISSTLLAAGIFSETKDTLRTIDSKQLDQKTQSEYFFIFSRLYIDMADYYQQAVYYDPFRELGISYLDSAVTVVDRNSSQYYSYKGLKNIRQGEFDEAVQNYDLLFDNYTLKGRQYAIDASTYSYALEQVGRTDEAMAWLIRAAIMDIKMANKENFALIKLADILYQQGDIKRSSKYLNVTLDDATMYGALQRKFQISQLRPIIETEKLNIAEKQKSLFQQYAIAVTILSIFVLMSLFVLFTQYKKLKAAKDQINERNIKLREVNLIKEEYIGFFFNTNSDYIDQMELFRQKIDNKITQNKIHEIRPILNSFNVKNDREKMYQTFDQAFLKIFPDFISKYNLLFDPEHQVQLEDPNTLNTELRIYALVRLGIHSTEKIAHILNYSVNTINTYKTRVKNKSKIPNEDFEKEIKKIQFT